MRSKREEKVILTSKPPPFNEETDWYGYILDSNCVPSLLETSTDADVTLTIMKFLPEVVWQAGPPRGKTVRHRFERFYRSRSS